MTDLLTELAPMVEGIASEFGRSNRVYGAEAGDFSQELYLWIVENEDQVRQWLDPELYGEKEGTRLLAGTLRNRARGCAVDIKAQALGYKTSDLQWYSRNEVKNLLPLVFSEDSWHEPPRSEGRSAKAPSEGGNWIATLADVAQAFAKLKPADQNLLRGFHADDWTNRMMAEAENVTHQAMSERHDRAIDRLVQLLGGTQPPQPLRPRDPWQGRRSVTNSAARAYQSGVYDE